MSLTQLFTLGVITHPGGQQNQIQRARFSPGIDLITLCADGSVEYTFTAVLNQKPAINFETSAIATALDYYGLNGLGFTAATAMYLQSIAQVGTRTGGASSIKLSGTKGIIVPRSLTWSDTGPAMLNLDTVFISPDGGTSAPIAVAASQTMPSLVAVSEVFVTGPVTINGASLSGIQGGTLDFGVHLVIENENGSAYPSFVGVMKGQRKLTLRSKDASYLSTLTVGGLKRTSTSQIFLRKVDAGGIRVANATAQHIKLSMTAGMFIPDDTGGSDGSPSELSMTWQPVNDLINDTVGINTASAIS